MPFLAFFLIIIAFIDIEYKLIFDKITIPGILIGIGCNILTSRSHVMNSIYGICAGSGFLIFIILLGYIFYKKESMGGGDIKFAAMIGSFIGLSGIVFSMIVAVLSAAIVGMLFMLKHGTEYIPFGPFLSLGAIAYLLISSRLIMFLN
jgi:leader peptidase (prepilin peptidase)/N-methyltransferase